MSAGRRAREHVSKEILVNFRHKKRRPWTSLDDEVVGRGKLNQLNSLLIYGVNFDFRF